MAINNPSGGGGSVGGLYGMNVETLTGNKTLNPNVDVIRQYLDEGGADRIITLATAGATAGDRFVIRHNGAYDDSHKLQVKQGAVPLDNIYAGGTKEFIFDGSDWIGGENGTGEADNKSYTVAIGRDSHCYKYGVGVGRCAEAYDYGAACGSTAQGYHSGAALGYQALGHFSGVAVGRASQANNYGVALGYYADAEAYGIAIGPLADSRTKKYAIALGYDSEGSRTAETVTNIDGEYTHKNNVVQGRWAGSTANATPVELLCGGQAGERFTVKAESVLAFKITVAARDNVAGHAAMYTFEGLIKRDGVDNTVLSVCNKTVIHEDDASWDCAVTADDANEALIITVTGDGANPTQFVAVLEGVETNF